MQAKQRAIGILNSLDDVGKTILSRTLVGEEPREMSRRSVSLLVAREEPDLLAGSVISSQGSSFTLPSSTDLFGNETQFVDTQVTFKTSCESSYDTTLTYFFPRVFLQQVQNLIKVEKTKSRNKTSKKREKHRHELGAPNRFL